MRAFIPSRTFLLSTSIQRWLKPKGLNALLTWMLFWFLVVSASGEPKAKLLQFVTLGKITYLILVFAWVCSLPWSSLPATWRSWVGRTVPSLTHQHRTQWLRLLQSGKIVKGGLKSAMSRLIWVEPCAKARNAALLNREPGRKVFTETRSMNVIVIVTR